MATKTTIFEQRQSGGTACFLIVNPDTPDPALSNVIDLTVDLTDSTVATPTVSITKMHWSGGVTVTSGAVSIPLTGNGAWCQFNGWTPVDCNTDITVSGTGTLFIEIKKLAGFIGRTDYSNAAI
jgi:hypothetical protein